MKLYIKIFNNSKQDMLNDIHIDTSSQLPKGKDIIEYSEKERKK